MLHLVYDQFEHAQDAGIEQVFLVLVIKINLHDCVKYVILDQARNALSVFGCDDCFKELNYLDVNLSRVELPQVCNFVEDLVFNEEDSHNDWDRRVLNQLR